MEFKIFLFLLFVSSSLAQESSVSCIYTENPLGYACNIVIENVDGRDDFTEIQGEHLEGRTNADVVYVLRSNGTTPLIPRVICNQFPNLERINLATFGIQMVRNNPFAECGSLNWLRLFNNDITEIEGNTFANNGGLTYIDLDRNRLALVAPTLFVGLGSLEVLELRNNPIWDLPATVFQPLTSITTLYLTNCSLTSFNSQWFVNLSNLRLLWLANNNFTVIESDSFPQLPSIVTIDLDNNEIETINPGAFINLSNLTTLYLNRNNLTWLSHDTFNGLSNVQNLYLNFNQLQELTEEIFWPINNLAVLGLWGNQLKTINRHYFGNLNTLRYIDLDSNLINAVERSFLEDAENLQTFHFFNNLCFSGSIFNFNQNRTQNINRLQRCYRNFEFTVDTVTEGDTNYNFYRFSDPGIFFRVDAPVDAHVSLNPFNFEAVPRVEILLGVANNTRSMIRLNGVENVVDISTPGILNPNSWSGFRVAFANWMIVVFREADQFPFMAFNMQEFYPINFYGLRTPGTVAPWSIQPLDSL